MIILSLSRPMKFQNTSLKRTLQNYEKFMNFLKFYNLSHLLLLQVVYSSRASNCLIIIVKQQEANGIMGAFTFSPRVLIHMCQILQSTGSKFFWTEVVVFDWCPELFTQQSHPSNPHPISDSSVCKSKSTYMYACMS